jgi:hypothetical protein
MSTTLPKQTVITKTSEALTANGFTVHEVKDGAHAKKLALELIPQGAEVMTMTSVTLDSIGLSDAINESSHFDAVKPKLYTLDRKTHGKEMNRMGAAPEVAIGSVHAVTQDGVVIIASNTGSQLPAYAYGSQKVIWVVSTKKIVANLDAGMRRLNEVVLPLESERARIAYGVDGSNISKLLIVNREIHPGRIHIIFVHEDLGY